MLGTSRDLRFLKGRIAKALALHPASMRSWTEFEALAPGTLALLRCR